MLDKTVDFGASDGPMSDEQLEAVQRSILHFSNQVLAPCSRATICRASQPSWNLPRGAGGYFPWQDHEVNDPAIASVNAGVKLLTDDIVVVHRLDGSGTSWLSGRTIFPGQPGRAKKWAR